MQELRLRTIKYTSQEVLTIGKWQSKELKTNLAQL